MTDVRYPFDLTWAEVDPATHPFDPVAAEGVVRTLPPAPRVPAGDPAAGDAWCGVMTDALVERYGRWAVGWRWARDEGDLGGGPVSAWCCVPHSMTSPRKTLRAIAAALCEWRAWLERLAALFDEHPLDEPDPVARQRVWRRATTEVIGAVVEQTGAGDAWYTHCEQVLTWYLTRWDVPAGRARSAVRKAIGGRFESWVGPDADVVRQVADDLKLS